MILFGAGSSIPFGIPGMAGFTEEFVAAHEEISKIIDDIREAISKSEELVGVSFPLDLELLLSVLNDLSGVNLKKSISIATASLLLRQRLSVKAARAKYRVEAASALDKLKQFIFKRCMQPIKEGEKKGDLGFLDRFYGPLITILNKVGVENVQPPVRTVYSTNWDLCFKKWADYVNIPISEWIEIDEQSSPVFTVETKTRSIKGFQYAPLHGSLDLVKRLRLKGGGAYEEITKMPDSIRYFEDKPDNIKDVFIIYPLEATGYEESIKSPYLDMLNHFRSSLRTENIVFIIGYSLRDPTIGSIFEEVIAERIRSGHLTPVSTDLDLRIGASAHHPFKIVVINPHPERLAENLRKQFNNNLLQTFIPFRIEFPEVADVEFDEKYAQVLSRLLSNLVRIGYIKREVEAQHLTTLVKSRYGFTILLE